MAKQSSVLILDDGELENIYLLLLKLGVDVVRLRSQKIGSSVEQPRDLLITAGKLTLRGMPHLVSLKDSPNSPIWVCVHSQDFMPMRKRLSEMGVHYLMQNALDEKSRERFLIQLLRKGAERRGSQRLHLGGELQIRIGLSDRSAKLVELSPEGCRIWIDEILAPGKRLETVFPSALGGGKELVVAGTVIRVEADQMDCGRDGFLIAIRFSELDQSKRDSLEGITQGERIGTQITPLAALPVRVEQVENNGSGSESADSNRRIDPRYEYDGLARVLGLGSSDADPVMGCDLSLSGVRLLGCQGIADSARIMLALYGAEREEPMVLEATVTRVSEKGEAALVFEEVSASNQKTLERILRSRPLLDSLDQPDSDSGRTIIAEIRETKSA